MVLDNRKNNSAKDPVAINNIPVSCVKFYKCLCTVIQENLKWNQME